MMQPSLLLAMIFTSLEESDTMSLRRCELMGFVLWFGFICSLSVAERSNGTTDHSAVPDDICRIISDASVSESSVLSVHSVQDHDRLVNYMRQQWEFVLNHLPKFAPEYEDRAVVLAAIAELDDRIFLKALQRLPTLLQRGEIDAPLVAETVCGYGTQGRFIRNNYRRPEVKAIMRKLLDDIPLTATVCREYLNSVLTGEGMIPDGPVGLAKEAHIAYGANWWFWPFVALLSIAVTAIVVVVGVLAGRLVLRQMRRRQ